MVPSALNEKFWRKENAVNEDLGESRFFFFLLFYSSLPPQETVDKPMVHVPPEGLLWWGNYPFAPGEYIYVRMTEMGKGYNTHESIIYHLLTFSCSFLNFYNGSVFI